MTLGLIKKREEGGGDLILVFRILIALLIIWRWMRSMRAIGNLYTWANNREGEGYVEEKLDRFFGAAS